MALRGLNPSKGESGCLESKPAGPKASEVSVPPFQRVGRSPRARRDAKRPVRAGEARVPEGTRSGPLGLGSRGSAPVARRTAPAGAFRGQPARRAGSWAEIGRNTFPEGTFLPPQRRLGAQPPHSGGTIRASAEMIFDGVAAPAGSANQPGAAKRNEVLRLKLPAVVRHNAGGPFLEVNLNALVKIAA